MMNVYDIIRKINNIYTNQDIKRYSNELFQFLPKNYPHNSDAYKTGMYFMLKMIILAKYNNKPAYEIEIKDPYNFSDGLTCLWDDIECIRDIVICIRAFLDTPPNTYLGKIFSNHEPNKIRDFISNRNYVCPCLFLHKTYYDLCDDCEYYKTVDGRSVCESEAAIYYQKIVTRILRALNHYPISREYYDVCYGYTTMLKTFFLSRVLFGLLISNPYCHEWIPIHESCICNNCGCLLTEGDKIEYKGYIYCEDCVDEIKRLTLVWR